MHPPAIRILEALVSLKKAPPFRGFTFSWLNPNLRAIIWLAP
jgi:hypothetical protein